MKYGATKEEILEVLKMTVWWKGAPALVKIVPDVLKYLDKKNDGIAEDEE